MMVSSKVRPALMATAMVLLAAGCSGADNTSHETVLPTDGNVATPDVAPTEVAGPVALPANSSTIGGDGSEIVLSALSPTDMDGAKLAGELGCSFAADSRMLLIAKGNVGGSEPARGVVKVGDYVEPVGAPGGFNAMVKGATFSGQGKSLRIAIVGEAIGGGESPAYPATLTYDRADGASRVFEGRWNCGP